MLQNYSEVTTFKTKVATVLNFVGVDAPELQ